MGVLCVKSEPATKQARVMQGENHSPNAFVGLLTEFDLPANASCTLKREWDLAAVSSTFANATFSATVVAAAVLRDHAATNMQPTKQIPQVAVNASRVGLNGIHTQLEQRHRLGLLQPTYFLHFRAQCWTF